MTVKTRRRPRAIRIYTMGFTQKSAKEFFTALKSAGVKRVVDVRLNNVSQLAGFTKKADLAYFLREIGDIDYVHLPELAPAQDLRDQYRKGGRDWPAFEEQFLRLMAERQVEKAVPRNLLDNSCLLCSEPAPDHCHRRLVAEYFNTKWSGVTIVHL